MKHLYSYVDEIYDYLNLVNVKPIETFITLLQIPLKVKCNIFTCGNGGSSSTASHFSQDLYKVCGLNSYCLSDNIGLVTAIANDYSYNKVFSYQLDKSTSQDDILFCISGSGNSPNLIDAVYFAKDLGIHTFSLTGNDGGRLKTISDFNINVPCTDMRQIESAHQIITHYIIDRLDNVN
jgi:D-sedoheptulose 7-phosphate isomerase